VHAAVSWRCPLPNERKNIIEIIDVIQVLLHCFGHDSHQGGRYSQANTNPAMSVDFSQAKKCIKVSVL